MNPATHGTEGNAAAPVLYMALELSNKTWRFALSDGAKCWQVSVPVALGADQAIANAGFVKKWGASCVTANVAGHRRRAVRDADRGAPARSAPPGSRSAVQAGRVGARFRGCAPSMGSPCHRSRARSV
jgi:hypothetical protein